MSARDVGSDEEYAPKFAAEAFKGNPQCQVFIYGNWPTPEESFEKPSLGRTEAHIENVGRRGGQGISPCAQERG